MDRRSHTPNCPSFGRAAGARYPLAVGAGGVGVGTRHEPLSARSCELTLRTAGRDRRSHTPNCPSFGGCGGGPLPTGCGCGGCRRGDPSRAPQRALLRADFAHCGAARGQPGGEGVSCLGVGRPWLSALRRLTAGLSSVRPGPATRYPLALGAGGVGVVTRHQPHRAHSCSLALGAAGAARGRPGGGRFLPGCGASWVGPSPTPDRLSLGRADGARYPLAAGAGGVGPETRHQPNRALLRAGFARCGGGTREPGGRASFAWIWGVLGWAITHAPPPILRVCGLGPLPTGCGCSVRAWGPVTDPRARALASWLCLLRGRHQGPPGGAGRLLPACGASVVGRSPTPDRPSFGHAAGARYPLAVGAGDVGSGTRHPPHSARSCELALRAAGRHEGTPRGGASLAMMWGVRG